MADVQQLAEIQPDVQHMAEIQPDVQQMVDPADRALRVGVGLHIHQPDQARHMELNFQRMAEIQAENQRIGGMHPPGPVWIPNPGQARQMRPRPDFQQRAEIHPMVRRGPRLAVQDDEDELDTTEEQAKRGKDIQGILWQGHSQRKHYREHRVAHYKNYENLRRSHSPIIREARKFKKGEKFYKFHFNKRSVQPTYMHFQLRNLVWATSKHDVYTFQNVSAVHYSSLTQKTTEVLNLSEPTLGLRDGAGGGVFAMGMLQAMFPPVFAPGRPQVGPVFPPGIPQVIPVFPPGRPQGGPVFPPGRQQIGQMRHQLRRARGWYGPQAVQMLVGNQQAGLNDPIQISTIIVKNNLLVAGGFRGQMVVRNLDSKAIAYNGRITYAENGITNAVDVFDSPSGDKRILTSSNDAVVRVYDCNQFSVITKYDFDWAVNHSSVSPDGRTLIAVGDSDEGKVVDLRSDQIIGTLRGHLDYSFASAWHPGGCIFATGNQDTTCRLWDFRQMDSAFAVLKGRMGAIRSIRFSSDGKFMAMAEPADFVHMFDTTGDFQNCQEVDIFGEIAGISFSPDTEALFIGVTDRTYGSLMEFNRIRATTSYLDSYFY